MAYWRKASSSCCLLLGQPQVDSALVPRSPAASPPTHTSSPPKSPGGFALQVPRAQLHHCHQVFPKLCAKNSQRLFIRELSQDPSAAQLVKTSPLPVGAYLYFHRGLYQTFSHWMKNPRQPEWLSPSDGGIFSKQPLLPGAGMSLVYSHGYNGPLGTAISQFSCGGGCGVAPPPPPPPPPSPHPPPPPSSKALLPQAASPEVASVPPGSLSLIQPLTNRILAGKGSLVRNVKSGFFLKQGSTLQ